MPMNLVIQEKRKELGLTQEPSWTVRQCSNVSLCGYSWIFCFAISKPDAIPLFWVISAICLQKYPISCCDKSSSKQNRVFRSVLSRRANGARSERSGLVEPFSHLLTAGLETLRYSATCSCVAKQKIHEYPHNETLLHCLTVQLDGLLTISGLSEEELRPYNATISQLSAIFFAVCMLPSANSASIILQSSIWSLSRAISSRAAPL